MSFTVGCECGRRIGVTAVQAGLSAACGCGRTVAVPSLRTLRAALPEPPADDGAARQRAEDRRVNLRVWGVAMAGGGQLTFCINGLASATQRAQGDSYAPGLLPLILQPAIFAVYLTGFGLWARSKGHPVWAGLLLAFLGPVGIALMLWFPSRDP